MHSMMPMVHWKRSAWVDVESPSFFQKVKAFAQILFTFHFMVNFSTKQFQLYRLKVKVTIGLIEQNLEGTILFVLGSQLMGLLLTLYQRSFLVGLRRSYKVPGIKSRSAPTQALHVVPTQPIQLWPL